MPARGAVEKKMIPAQPDPAYHHLMHLPLKESLFELETHVTGSPFTVVVYPGEAFGRRSEAWGDALSNITAGVVANLTVRARDVVGNAIWDGGSELEVYAFHQELEVRCRCHVLSCRRLAWPSRARR